MLMLPKLLINAIAVIADSAAYSTYISYDAEKKNTFALSAKQKKAKKRETFFRDTVNRGHSRQFCLVRYMYGGGRLFRKKVSKTPVLSFHDEN